MKNVQSSACSGFSRHGKYSICHLPRALRFDDTSRDLYQSQTHCRELSARGVLRLQTKSLLVRMVVGIADCLSFHARPLRPPQACCIARVPALSNDPRSWAASRARDARGRLWGCILSGRKPFRAVRACCAPRWGRQSRHGDRQWHAGRGRRPRPSALDPWSCYLGNRPCGGRLGRKTQFVDVVRRHLPDPPHFGG